MLYQCSGYSRLVCGGCPKGKKHEKHWTCEPFYCSLIKEELACEPVEEERDE